MKQIYFLTTFALLFLGAFSFPLDARQSGAASPEETTKSVEILREVSQNENPSDEQLQRASAAILQLTQTGTPDAVPELKKLLNVEQLNTVVRTALINMSGESGMTALRESLETLNGKNLAGALESLGSARDEKSVSAIIKLAGEADETVAQAAFYALGKIATPEAVTFLLDRLKDAGSEKRETAANALLFAAERKVAFNQNELAAAIYAELAKFKEFPTVFAGAVRYSFLLNEERALPIFAEMLRRNNDSQYDFKYLLELARQLKASQTGKIILDNFSALPTARKAALIEIIGDRKDAAVVPELLKIVQRNELPLKIAAVKALGEIGNMRGLNAILYAVGSSDQELSAAGRESLSRLQGEEFRETVVRLLDSPDKKIRSAALYVVGERRITEAEEKLRTLFDDPELYAIAYDVFAKAADVQSSDLKSLLIRFVRSPLTSMYSAAQRTEMEAMKTMCLRMTDPNAAVAAIEEIFIQEANALAPVPATRAFILELLFLLGGEKAAKDVADAALNDEDYVRDKATELLGNWTTSDVAPFLLELAGKFPAGGKYQTRTLRGYIRVIRQMGLLSPEQKIEMSRKALALAARDEDKKLAEETLKRFSENVGGTLLFDGKTFENWEFRNEENAKWFRIEDGAIVGGSREKPIPRNEFITTKKEYGDFTLRLEAKVIGKGANAGVQLRSQRLPQDGKNPNEVSGYQADMTSKFNYWGSLYDESRRNKFLAEAKEETVKPIFRENDWNDLEIICKGDTVKILLNGVPTIEYRETDETISRKGIIGLQIHAAGPSEAWYRNIRIEKH
ncbi:MAG: DUF1080 domain-containing protein [Planctomycetaceae bacterium]|jgi:HEAT repeat protein|nr:DUF1080 domain-containing protein [Planctomycetaceae bacterium]